MSTWVPSAASVVLPGESPIVGSVDEIAAARMFVDDMADNAANYKFVIGNAGNRLLGAQSKSTTKIAEKVNERLVPGATLLVESAGTAKDAFKSYESEVDRIHGEARKLIKNVDSDLGTISAQVSEINSIATQIHCRADYRWDEGAPGAMPEPRLEYSSEPLEPAERERRVQLLKSVYGNQWTRAAVLWHNAIKDIQSGRTKWQNLLADRKNAEHRLVNGLSETYLGQLITLGGGSGGRADWVIAAGISGEVRGVVRSIADIFAPELKNLLTGDLTPEEAAQEWKQLGLSPEDVAKMPVEVLAQLANLNGIPAWAQDVASRHMVVYALDFPADAYRLMGFTDSGLTLDKFTEQVTALRSAVEDATVTARDLPGDPSPIVQLVGFGNHEGALTAAISLGNMDSASNVAVNVAGMNSSVGGIGGDVGGAEALFQEAARSDPDGTFAVVTWIGYHSPGYVEVNFMDRARAGAIELTGFLDGINANRNASGVPIKQFSVLAHSYGSTTAVEALKKIDFQLDSFVTYGSAGVDSDTTVEQLHVDNMYSTHASGDQVAPIGIDGSGRTDPLNLPGVIEFSAEGNGDDSRVTAHDMFTKDEGASFWNWGGKVGYLSPNTGVVKDMGHVIANGDVR